MLKDRFLASFWTLACGTVPWVDGKEFVPVDFRHRVELMSKAGFRGIGLLGPDLAHVRETLSYPEMRQILDDNGLVHREVEFLLDWYVDGEARRKSDAYRKIMMESAEGLRAHHIKVGYFKNEDVSDDRLASELAKIADEAKERGTKVLFEMIPRPVSRISTLDEGLALMRDVNRANCGLMVDLWHMRHSGITDDEIRQKLKGQLFRAEINDGKIWPLDEIPGATVDHRQLPGDGDFDVTGFLQAISDIGYEGAVGVEVLNKKYRSETMEELTPRVYDACVSVVPKGL